MCVKRLSLFCRCKVVRKGPVLPRVRPSLFPVAFILQAWGWMRREGTLNLNYLIFLFVVVSHWNKLPWEVVDIASLEAVRGQDKSIDSGQTFYSSWRLLPILHFKKNSYSYSKLIEETALDMCAIPNSWLHTWVGHHTLISIWLPFKGEESWQGGHSECLRSIFRFLYRLPLSILCLQENAAPYPQSLSVPLK